MHSTENGPDPGLGDGDVLSSGSGRSVATVGAALGSTVAQAPPSSGLRECAGCGKRITERFLLKAIDLFWHEDCLKCGCCDCRLGEVGSTLYTKANLILCRRDYLRLFGTTGYCAACNKVIPAFEMVMRAKSNVYHLECFACQQCNHRFCVGDRFYLCDNKILCEYDYEERLVFANMAYNPSSLAHIRRQVGNLQSAGNNLTQSFGAEPPPQGQTMFSRGDCKELPRGGASASGVSAVVSDCGGSATLRNASYSIRDDGSSGYGSPDSDTFDPRKPPTRPKSAVATFTNVSANYEDVAGYRRGLPPAFSNEKPKERRQGSGRWQKEHLLKCSIADECTDRCGTYFFQSHFEVCASGSSTPDHHQTYFE